MSFIVVIPARFASTRLPGKPLLDIAGKPMIQHVFERAMESDASRVVIATDDDRILRVCEGFGAEVLMTSVDHVSGTDRLEEVARQLEFAEDVCIVNVQGDEPLIPAALINQVGHNLLANPDAAIATLSERINDIATVFNPNVVKVVSDVNGFAHYFSRAPIPWARNAWAGEPVPDEMPQGCDYYRHIGIYGYRVSLLRNFVNWPPAPSEVTESLEQLRALHHGARIHVDVACEPPPSGVDTEEDLQRLRALLTQSEK